MKKRSWKTTAGGIFSLLGTLAVAGKQALAGDFASAIGTLSIGIPAGLALLAARDNDVTSRQAGAE